MNSINTISFIVFAVSSVYLSTLFLYSNYKRGDYPESYPIKKKVQNRKRLLFGCFLFSLIPPIAFVVSLIAIFEYGRILFLKIIGEEE